MTSARQIECLQTHLPKTHLTSMCRHLVAVRWMRWSGERRIAQMLRGAISVLDFSISIHFYTFFATTAIVEQLVCRKKLAGAGADWRCTCAHNAHARRFGLCGHVPAFNDLTRRCKLLTAAKEKSAAFISLENDEVKKKIVEL